MRLNLAARILLAAAPFALGCSPATSPLDLAGVYTLTSVNGAPLPYMFPQAGAITVEVLGDAYTLSAGGVFAEAGQKRFSNGGSVAVTFPIDAGNFTRRGDAITIESLLFGVRTGTIRNGTLTIVQQELTLVYER